MSRPSHGTNARTARVLSIVATIWAVVYPVWLALTYRPGAPRPFVANVAFVPMNVMFAAVSALTATRPADPRLRRAFVLLSATWIALFAGNVCKFIFVQLYPLVDWSASWFVNLPFLLGYPLLVTGLLSFPLARRARLERRKFFFDAITVLLGGGLAIWRLVLVPTAGSPTTAAGFFDLAYPLGDILLLTGLTTVLLRRRHDGRRAAPALLFGGLLLYTLSDLANDLVLKDVGFKGVAWTDIVFMAAYTMMIWGAYTYGAPARTLSDPPEEHDRSDVQPFSPLPYAALALCAALLLVDALHARTQSWSILASGEIALTVLVVARQIHAVRENARLVSQRAARDNEARFRSLVQHSSDVIAVVDPAGGGTIRYVSPSVTRVLGYGSGTLDGRPLASLLHPDDAIRADRMLADAVTRSGVTAPTEWRIQHQDGRWMFVEAVGTNLMDEPTVRGVVVNTRDITERKSLEAQLVHQAFHDPLTGLANRALFLDRVTHALDVTSRYGRQPVAVLFLDLDNFKTINDSFGHIPADQLLAVVARRLVDAVRTSDTVARLGGDEFAILLEDPAATVTPSHAAERITASLSAPFLVEGKEVFVTASIGIAIANQDFSPADLLRNADTAMYQAKARGKARYEVFEARMHAETLARLELENELRRALERNELALRYQPIVSLRDGTITGMEALVRWEHPRRGTLLPAEFIALAEDTGLIVPIGEWVLIEACRQAKQWQDRYGPAVPFTMTVNVSGHQLQNAGMASAVQAALADSALDPATLVLEITESVLMQQTDTLLTHLKALKALHVRLAIDDFGTGYSSLSYLKRFPIDILKIAKPFIDDVGSGLTDSALARAIIGLGDTLKLQTIAEGIELPAQLAELRALGCELGQGYYFARPLAPAAIEALLDNADALSLPQARRVPARS
ncbi:MAG TPA: EAL domain-containing protein [Gemmatimonadaceae bacterium]|nr:EAL domain-containing protein [Gemmatimonadaceae bacterium]